MNIVQEHETGEQEMGDIKQLSEFRAFGKIPRLSRGIIISEKIDGTNAQVFIGDDGEFLTGSRTRWITPGNDNFGFSQWAHDHKDELMLLGPGHHYGEWWGVGIQRGYGLSERRFSLFNTARWGDLCTDTRPTCCGIVPILYQGEFHTGAVNDVLQVLREHGSLASPGFAHPEGIVVYHTAAGHYYKKTCEHDDEPKNVHPKKERGHQNHPKEKQEPQIMLTGGRRCGATGYAGPERRIPR